MNPWPHSSEEPEIANDEACETPESVSTDVEPREEQDQCPEAMEYVNQLIARMNSSTVPAAFLGADRAKAPPPRVANSAPADNRVTSRPPQAVPPSVAKETPKVAPTRRPQRPSDMPTDLTRLREAANLTATHDLKAHEFRRSVVKAYSDLAMVVASMATSLVLVSLSDRLFSVAYGCALATLLQAAISTRRFFQTTEVLTRKASNQPVVSESTS